MAKRCIGNRFCSRYVDLIGRPKRMKLTRTHEIHDRRRHCHSLRRDHPVCRLTECRTFAGFSLVIGLCLVPAGALMAQSWNAATFAPMAGNFVPLLAPANQMRYDTVQFYNSALAIVAGCGAAALAFRLLPPLSRTFRAQRLLQLTLRDLRRLATVHRPTAARRLGSPHLLPAARCRAAEPLQRAQLVTALSVGTEIIDLRRIAPQLGFESEFHSALEPFTVGKARTGRLRPRWAPFVAVASKPWFSAASPKLILQVRASNRSRHSKSSK